MVKKNNGKNKFVESLDCDDLCYIKSVKNKDDSIESREMKKDVLQAFEKKKCGPCGPQ